MLKIYGSGDDNVYANIEMQRECPACGCEIEEPTQAVVGGREDEFGCYEQIVSFTIGGDDGGIIVEMSYENPGVWAGKAKQLSEDTPIPWPVTVTHEGYSVVVNVDCPDGTPVKMEKRST
jgi:hypothetical protein